MANKQRSNLDEGNTSTIEPNFNPPQTRTKTPQKDKVIKHYANCFKLDLNNARCIQ